MRRESLVKELIEGRMKGKRERGKSRIILLDEIKNNDTYEMIYEIYLNLYKFGEVGCLEPA